MLAASFIQLSPLGVALAAGGSLLVSLYWFIRFLFKAIDGIFGKGRGPGWE